MIVIFHGHLSQITVTPLGGLSPAELDAVSFFRNWLPGVVDHHPSSAL